MTTVVTAGEWLTEAIEERTRVVYSVPRNIVARKHILALMQANLAQIAALKAIVELHSWNDCEDDERPGDAYCRDCYGDYPCETLRTVAAIFAGREGYERWFGGANEGP